MPFQSDWPDYVKMIITGIVSVTGSWFVFRQKKQPEDRVDFQTILTDYKEQVEALRTEVASLKEEVDILRKDRDYFRNQIQLLQAAHHTDPFPRWTKDAQGRMIYVSKGYEEMFLKPLGYTAEDYIGKRDHDIWGDITGHHFAQQDKYVQETGEMWIGFETHVVDGVDILQNFYFVKTPLYVKGTKHFIGTEGRAIPLPEELHRLVCNT